MRDFQIFAFLAWAAACLIIFALLYVGILNHPPGTRLLDQLLSRHGLLDPLTIAGLIATPLLGIVIFVILRQALFRGGGAIWINEGNLFYLNQYGAITFSCLPMKDIDHFSLGSNGVLQPTGILAHLNSGDKRYIPTILLEEPKDIILRRMSEALVGASK